MQRTVASNPLTMARWIAINLQSTKLLFTGGQGPGFDDLLLSRGYESLVSDVLFAFDHAINQASALDHEGGWPSATSDIQTLHESVHRLVQLLTESVGPALGLSPDTTTPHEDGAHLHGPYGSLTAQNHH